MKVILLAQLSFSLAQMFSVPLNVNAGWFSALTIKYSLSAYTVEGPFLQGPFLHGYCSSEKAKKVTHFLFDPW